MYIPSAFNENRREVLHDLIRRYGFATVVSTGEGGLVASHLPVLLDAERGPRGVLRSHMARGNPQWRQFVGGEAMVIFQGPHGYISPTAYATKLAVPTWNYVVVHAYGVPRLIEDGAGLRRIVEETTRQYEATRPQPWPMDLSEDFMAGLLRGIVGFELEITRLEGKWKLSQNRPAADREGAIAALESSGDAGEAELARWMRE